jgi:hypothetical protein
MIGEILGNSTVSEFALEMIEGVEKVSFINGK